MSLIRVSLNGSVGTITFDNLEKRNALSNAMVGELVEALDGLVEGKVSAVILRAPPGSKVWSAGFDVDDLPVPGRDPLGYDDPLEVLIRKIQTTPAPVIAMVEGSVWGGACDLTFVCDLAIGCETATFAMTPARLGLPYNTSGILHFINLVGPRVAREMFFLAQPIDARRALEVGILNQLVPSADLEARTAALASQIAGNSPLSIAVIKEQLHILGNSYPIQPETFERAQGLRRKVYDSQDYVEGRKAFQEKRRPIFTGR
jgi:methylmalonyl-CoA decarboxylase